MSEERNEEVALPKPMFDWVIVENPLTDIKEVEAHAESLPPQDRPEYLESVMVRWDNLKVISVGPKVEWIKAGDTVKSTPDRAQGDIKMGESHIMIKENAFIAIW